MTVTSEELSINSIFGEGGLFHQKYGETYEVRDAQVALASFVDHCLKTNSHFVGEAPCGTGKSYGYLVPAILKCYSDRIKPEDEADEEYDDQVAPSDDEPKKKRNRTRVVVATANITLQEQLIKKDLPALKELLTGIDFSYCLVKGRGNFLCHDKIEEASLNLHKELSKPEEIKVIQQILNWAERTTTGDRSQTGFNVPDHIWSHFTISDNDCKQKGCKFFEQCFSRKNRRQANSSDIIVANYHIVLIDLELKKKIGRGILPSYKYVIFDEAHKLEEVSRDYFGKEFNNYSVRRATGALKDVSKDNRENKPYAETLNQLSDQLNTESQMFFANVMKYRTSKEPNYTYTRLGDKVADADKLLRLLTSARDLVDEHASFCLSRLGETHADTIKYFGRVGEIEDMIEKLTDNIEQSEPGYCYWIESQKTKKSETVKLIMRPMEVSTHLNNLVWNQLNSGVMVSATLAEGGELKPHEITTPQVMERALLERFSFVLKSVGLPYDTRKFICDSPFDFKANCAVIIPKDFPEPTPQNTETHRRAFLKASEDAILEAGGRTMVLFTSHAHLKQFYEGCHRLKKAGIKIYAQGLSEENKSELGDLFKKNEKSVLLGTSSYWEGVDVPGNSLMLLIIDKLPFPNFQQDPILAAMKDRDSSSFWNEEYIPRMTIKFKQGIGRLIRTKSDTGLLIIGDKRCLPGPGAKNYASKVFSAIPPMPISTDITSAKMFFDHLKNKGVISD